MATLHPLTDPAAWARLLAGAAAIVVLPGWLWVGRHLRRADLGTRLYAATVFGLVLAAVGGRLLSWAGAPLTPPAYLALVLAAGAALGAAGGYRRAVGSLARAGDRSGAGGQLLLLAAVLGYAAIVIWGLRDYVVPPTIHDAANHAFMVKRIAETSSVALPAVFGPPQGAGEVPYLMGWHVAAALIARTAGLPPYVAAWLLPYACLMLLPVACAVLWRRWGFPPAAAACGAFLIVVPQMLPLESIFWGGLGMMVGFFAAPFVTLLVGGFLRAGGGERGGERIGAAWLGLPAGLAVAAMIHIHGPELVAVLILTALTFACAPAGDRRPRVALAGVAVFAAALALGAGLDVLAVGRAYRGVMAPPEPVAAGFATSSVLAHSAGFFWPSRVLLALGFLLALRRRQRVVALAALGLAAFVIALRVESHDRVLLWLTTPFYHGWPRVVALQVFLVPPLIGLPLALGYGRWAAAGRTWRLAGAALVALGLAFAVRFPLQITYLPALRSPWLRGQTLFFAEDYRLARRIGEVVGADAVVANLWDDGSPWAMHVSGRRFLLPAGWPLQLPGRVPWRQAVAGFLRPDWPEETRRLEADGVTHLYVRDEDWRHDGGIFARAVFDADPRFERVLAGEASGLYRIRWEALPDRPAPPAIATGSATSALRATTNP